MLIIGVLWSCQEPVKSSTPLNCPPNAHANADSTNCDCDSLYHWNEDQTECVLDTSSHEFTWQLYTIGGHGSFLRDAKIISENDIWVVGQIQLDTGYYNAAHWDGSTWQILALSPWRSVYELYSMFWFSDTNIWYGNLTLPMYYNGHSFYVFSPDSDDYPGGYLINSIYGTFSNDMYFAGDHGSIVHYNGEQFTTLNTPTDVDLQAILASADGDYIFFQGRNDFEGYGTILLQLHNYQMVTIYRCETLYPESGNYGRLYSSYVWGDTVFSATKAGVWKYNYRTRESILIPDSIAHIGEHYIKKIIGNSSNDYILVGNWWDFTHYNGKGYSLNTELEDYLGWGSNSGIDGGDMKGNLAIVCGEIYAQTNGAVAIGRRE